CPPTPRTPSWSPWPVPAARVPGRRRGQPSATSTAARTPQCRWTCRTYSSRRRRSRWPWPPPAVPAASRPRCCAPTPSQQSPLTSTPCATSAVRGCGCCSWTPQVPSGRRSAR
ncbi:MAG: FIG024795: hypothetical protein, partial [uncultured Nocardioidaceae bacterium]